MRIAFFAALYVGIGLCAAPADAAPRFWGALTPGDHAVGFRVAGSGAAELHVWYPARPSSDPPLTLGEYLALARDLRDGLGADGSPDAAAALAGAITGAADGLTASESQALLDTRTAAIANAARAGGRFPLVFWTDRYGTTVAQHVLSEYLASHGFVVVYAPHQRAPRLPSEFADERGRAGELQSQVRRLRAALRRASRLPDVDRARTAVLAWSYAGETAHALQRAEPGIQVAVGLSTNLVSGWVYRSGGADTASLRVPIVLIDGAARPVPEALAGAPRDTYAIGIPDMAHGSFNALEGMIPSVAGITRVQRWSASGPAQQRGYEAAAQYVERVLEHFLIAERTMDTPFRLWRPDGEPPIASVITAGGTRPVRPRQPRGFTTVRFAGAEGEEVTADWYPARRGAATIVLAHQSMSSRGEYRQIAPRLVQLGYNALAIDTRWGDRDMWNGVANETARRHGTAASLAGPPAARRAIQDRSIDDIRAAVAWVRKRDGHAPILLWGSSISANLVLKLAAAEPDVAGVLAFSPAEYHPDTPDEIRRTVATVRVPTLVAYGRDERDAARPVFEGVAATFKRELRASHGRHGSSILLDDPATWAGVRAFLREIPGR